MRFLNKKSVVFGLLMLLSIATILSFTPQNAGSFGPNSQQQKVLIIDTSDTDSTESEDDNDDEWEA